MDEFLSTYTYWSDMNFSLFTGKIIEQLEKMSSSIGEIKGQLNTQKSWWQEYDQLISAVVGAMVAVSATFIIQFLIERKRRFGKLVKAIASFENTRVTLLMFKGQFIRHYCKEMVEILHQYYKCAKKENKQLPNKDNHYKLPDLVIIEEICPIWVELETPFEFYKEQTFYKDSWAEELSFIASHHPEYLVTFHKAFESVSELNKSIQERNNIIKRYREKSIHGKGVDLKEIRDAIYLHLDFAKQLKMLVDTSLELHKFSSEHLNDYAKKTFRLRTFSAFKNLLNFKIKTNYEHFMPKKYWHIDGYVKTIKELIKKRRY